MNKPNSLFRKFIQNFSASSGAEEGDLVLEELTATERRNFSFETLVAATSNFDSSRKLGEGGFGSVFRGKLIDGTEIAVKRLSHTSTQGKREFQNEAKKLACLQHRNVVNFLGHCAHDGERLLVYEYMPNGSLDKLLFKSNRRDSFDWRRRHDVMMGVAKGLLYLHEEAPCPDNSSIIHRDIKPSNILLDDKWVPKIADFGMARFFSQDQTHATTRIVGTNGYMAPEYFSRAHLSQKADVYSFGVVILELISGQKNSTFNRDPDLHNLLEWAYKLYKKGRSWEVIDPLLTPVEDADRDQFEVCLQVGLLCVQTDPELRPKVSRVVEILSRKPKNLEEPCAPGYFGSGRKKSRESGTRSSDVSSSQSSEQRSSAHTSTLSVTTSTIRRQKRHV